MTGRRGTRGEFTAKVPSGDAARWTRVARLRVVLEGRETHEYDVESVRAYRDRLVVKLVGIDDVDQAERLRGADLAVDMADAPPLPEGVYWLDDLVGRTVVNEHDEVLGRVDDVAETAGGEVLVVGGVRGSGDEILIPLVREFVSGIEEGTGRLRVRIPDDLRDLNRHRTT